MEILALSVWSIMMQSVLKLASAVHTGCKDVLYRLLLELLCLFMRVEKP